MLNLPLIYKILGNLLYFEAILLGICYGVGFWHEEANNYLTFGLPLLVAVGVGMAFHMMGVKAEPRMSRRDGFLVVGLTYLCFSIVGTLPLLIGGFETRLSAAFFEAVSGFSTTGATIFDDIDSLPRSILLWRSLSQWVGGMGIVFFTIAVLPNIGSSNMKLFAAEATGLKLSKLHPRLSTTARWLWGLYILLTLFCSGVYFLLGMTPFDAINHGFTTIATGGFSTHQASIAYFQSPGIDWAATGFMLLSGINFTLIYLMVIRGRFRTAFRDEELRLYLGTFFVAATGMALILYFSNHLSLEEAVRNGCFNLAALISTTGYTGVDFMDWHPTIWMILTIVGVVGGCAGSTSGGLKCIRALTVWKIIRNEFRLLIHPRAVLPVKINGTPIGSQVGRTMFVFFSVYFMLLLSSSFVMVAMGVPLLDSFSLAFSSLSNIGPTIGHAVPPTASWSGLGDGTLWLNSLLMLAGRLEIFSILLLFTPSFWKDE